MANEIRRRYNFMSGIISDNPLSNSATTLNSTNLAGLPAVGSTEYVALVLDPTGVGNGPEVVYVTAHTGSATSATIVRGREGTSGVQHASTIAWVHVATAADFSAIGDDNDQPSSSGLPYEGQMYVDTTNDELEFYNGSAWTPFNYGAWLTWSPSYTNLSVGNGTATARYARLGRTVVFQWRLLLGTTSTIGTLPTISLPVTAATSFSEVIMTGKAADASAGLNYSLFPDIQSSGATVMRLVAEAGAVSATVPFTWATTDAIGILGVYEAAS